MQEVMLPHDISLLQIPKGERMYGVVLPCSLSLNKDDVAILRQREAREANQRFKVGRMLGEYTRKYGEHVFYLGTYRNPSGGEFRLFSFPVKHRESEDCDATMVSRSCQALVTMCKRYGVGCCLVPDIDMDYQAFHSCIKPIYDLIFDNSFILVHRKDK